jgi:hypothetical protein
MAFIRPAEVVREVMVLIPSPASPNALNPCFMAVVLWLKADDPTKQVKKFGYKSPAYQRWACLPIK